MAIVSISEAARITGKARSTIQSYIKTGKLSKTTDSHTGAVGIDTSELIRYFGRLNTTPIEHVVSEQISQQTTDNSMFWSSRSGHILFIILILNRTHVPVICMKTL